MGSILTVASVLQMISVVKQIFHVFKDQGVCNQLMPVPLILDTGCSALIQNDEQTGDYLWTPRI